MSVIICDSEEGCNGRHNDTARKMGLAEIYCQSGAEDEARSRRTGNGRTTVAMFRSGDAESISL